MMAYAIKNQNELDREMDLEKKIAVFQSDE